MITVRQWKTARMVTAWCIACAGMAAFAGQQVDNAAIIQKIDAAVKARVDGIAGYTDTEYYAVFRSGDETHPVAEMTVKTTYRRDTGKSYAILSESGSAVIRNLVLHAILENEQQINSPASGRDRGLPLPTMKCKLKPGGIQKVDGRDCVALDLTPRRKAPYLVQGTLWVDAKNGKIVQLQGKASKSSSLLTGPTQMMRQYADIGGFAEATHARAESDSFLFGPNRGYDRLPGLSDSDRSGP